MCRPEPIKEPSTLQWGNGKQAICGPTRTSPRHALGMRAWPHGCRCHASTKVHCVVYAKICHMCNALPTLHVCSLSKCLCMVDTTEQHLFVGDRWYLVEGP